MTSHTFNGSSYRLAQQDLGRTIELSHQHCDSPDTRQPAGRYDHLFTVKQVSRQRLDKCLIEDREDAERVAMAARIIDPTADIWVKELGWGWCVKVRERTIGSKRGKVETLLAFYGLRQAGHNLMHASRFARWTHRDDARLEVVDA